MAAAEFGIIGLGVMGSNLARNVASRGIAVACYDFDARRREDFAAAFATPFTHSESLPDLLNALASPRRIMLMVTAGAPVDEVLQQLLPLLAPGDVVIDGGNSQWQDTERRVGQCAQHQVRFVGCGVSGGELGALTGPCLMPGGAAEAWPLLRPVFEAIAARTADDEPCVNWIGPGGAGHFVKMVHNGIEYADMQWLSEVYLAMRDGAGMDNDAMAAVFAGWNNGPLRSYLVEITAAILAFRDDTGHHPVDYILDAAGQKGTGGWTVRAALAGGQPLPAVAEAVFARNLSALTTMRGQVASRLGRPSGAVLDATALSADALAAAAYCTRATVFAQSFSLIAEVGRAQGWALDLARLAEIWRGGCIIRADFLDTVAEAYRADEGLPNLLLDPAVASAIEARQQAWRDVLVGLISAGVAAPVMSAALAYFDGLRTARGGANLLQAQRDYFGAHTYERTDAARGRFFHTRWY
ncbi:MAG: NADP-dependent phosphogluconate dehydrogenase [Gammaproteobacteria bacterium]|nr:NADP-dependent phosphogluconate dehydrogenase [Gammaproteobacteria bacterium]